jgi:phosphotransferase system HPr-like phosphotransfer protein
MEAFAQGVTSGLSLSDAYRAAYVTDQMDPASVHTLAYRLMTDVQVRSRIEVLNREIEDNRRMMAVSDAEAALKTLRQMMRQADTDSVKVRAAELLAKASGMFTDKVEVTDTTDRSVDQIQAAITDRLRRLGLAG